MFRNTPLASGLKALGFGLFALPLCLQGQSAESPSTDQVSPVQESSESEHRPAHFCATHQTEDDLAWLRAYQADPQAFAEAHDLDLLRRGGDILVPVQVHILGNDDGVGYYRLDQLYGSFCDLNERFEPTGFYFFISGEINYVDNDTWYEHDFFQGSNMMQANNVAGKVNMYFVSDPAGACGYYSPFRDAVAIAKSCAGVGETTITHELGHFFSLPHTFFGWESGEPPLSQQERVDGSNCSSAADGFCDTPPDYAPYRWNCPTTGPFTDPNGVSFVPDGTFYMSYSNDACTERFSLEQQDAMRANLIGRGSSLPVGGPDPVALDSAVLVEPLDGATETAYNFTVLKWNGVPDATQYLVTVALNSTMSAVVEQVVVSDTFFICPELNQDRRHYWSIKPLTPSSFCAPTSEVRLFTTGEVFSGISPTGESLLGLAAWPNPKQANQPLQLSVESGAAFQVQVRLIDLAGRTMAQRQWNLQSGNNRTEWELPALPSGMYMVELSAMVPEHSGRWTQKVLMR